MVDELLRRRSYFRDGRKIRLADGQIWTLPAPTTESEWTAAHLGPSIQVSSERSLEAENASGQHLAELAFAIFLLGHNYCLSPMDYERLLDFVPGSPDSRDAQRAPFHRTSQEHIYTYLTTYGADLNGRQDLPTQRRSSRLMAWLRNHSPSRWWSVDSRSC